MSENDSPDVALPWDQVGIPKPANNILSKAMVRESYRQHQMPQLRAVWDAQMAKARGVKHLVVRNVDGTYTRVTDMPAEELDAVLAAGGTRVEVHLRDPDHKAIEDILNRCMDKAKEQEQEVIVHDGDRIRERLEAWKREHRKAE